MWAVIGMYGGQEDNAFYRRAPSGLEAAGGRELPAGEVLLLGDDVIHSVANSRREFAVALHVYGGDFFSVDRSEWDFETYREQPRDFERTRRLFEEADSALEGRPPLTSASPRARPPGSLSLFVGPLTGEGRDDSR